MKVITRGKKTVRLDSIPYGEYFKWNGNYYVRVGINVEVCCPECEETFDCDEYGHIIYALDLKNCVVEEFDNYYLEVEICDCEVTIAE